LQYAAVEVVTAPAWKKHLRATSKALDSRSAILATELATALPDCVATRPAGGVSSWLRLPRGVDDVQCTQRAYECGVAVAPGNRYQLGEQPDSHLRLSFANLTAAKIPVAVTRLATAIGQLSEAR
jgi:DNA-binding transcriptional MocR family regulator